MSALPKIHGVIPALVTPFTDNGELDTEALRRLTAFVLDAGVHGIMTVGGTGEFPLLSRDERARVTAIVAEETDGRVPVIAGIMSCATAEAILLARDAADAGAEAVIMTPPYYYPLPDDTVADYFRSVARESPLPLIAYNNPGYTGHNIAPRLIAELIADGTVFALKQSNADLGQLVESLRLVASRAPLLTGIDSQFVSSLVVGGVGIFSTAACAVPAQVVDIYNAAIAGNYQLAAELQMNLQPLNRFFEYDPGYVAPCKEVLSLQGICGSLVRSPLPKLTADQRDEIKAAFAAVSQSA